MDSPKYICPVTKKIINQNNQIGSYLRWQSKKLDISSNELLFLVYCQTFPTVAPYNEFYNYYINLKFSLPKFRETFGLNYKATEFLISWHNIPKRSLKEACLEGARRAKETNLKRYGVDQTFKVPKFEKKRRKTYLKKYGVDNPFKIKHFQEGAEKAYQEKYGHSLREHRSLKSKETWVNKTPEEKRKWLESSLFSEGCRENWKSTVKGNESSCEIRIQNCLTRHKISYQTQHRINPYYYDLFISDINLIIEVNGWFWHADPRFFKPNDIIPKIGKTANEIWEKDKKKLDLAKEKGYNVIVLWESDFKKLSEENLFIFIYGQISKAIEDKKNHKIK